MMSAPLNSARSMSARPRSLRFPMILAACLFSLAALAADAQTLQKTVVTIDGNGNGIFEPGETVQYTLVFTNSGLTDLNGVVIRDDSSACITIDIASLVIEPASGGTDASSGNAVQVDLSGPLAPGASVTITFVASATAEGSCCNQASWSAPGLAGGLSDRDPTDTFANQPTCHFAATTSGLDYDAIVDKQVMSAGCLAPGSTVGFRIFIQNVGRRPLRNGLFNDVLPAGFTNVVVSGGLSYDPATNRVFSSQGTYGVGQTTEFIYEAVIPCTASGSLTNTGVFTFEDNSGLMSTRSDSETVTWGLPDMVDSTKTWSDDPTDGDSRVSPGELVTFTITVRSSGACEALNILVTDELDPRFVSSAPTLVISDGGTFDPTTGVITWDQTTTPRLAALATGSDVTLTFSTRVDGSTPEGTYIPNSVTITPLGNVTSCPGLPPITRTITMQNGDVVYGVVPPTTILLRNDYISCRASAFAVMANGGVDGIPVLRVRPPPQVCSNPPAINTAHPQTDVFVNPTSPLFLADAAWVNEVCPQIGAGSGRVLIFYELQDDCTDTLRVTKDPSNASLLVVTW